MQRVLFANAIDPVPELLILDEPASGLDRAASERLESILGALKRDSGTTVFLVSHDLGSVRRIADRATVLNKRVQKDGAPAEVLGAGAEPPWTS
jgi:zinc transport system ATP-binding protein